MQLPSESRFRLRDERRAPWWMWGTALLLHIPVVLFLAAILLRHGTSAWLNRSPQDPQVDHISAADFRTYLQPPPPPEVPSPSRPSTNSVLQRLASNTIAVAPSVRVLAADTIGRPRGIPVPNLLPPIGASGPIAIPSDPSSIGRDARIAPAYGTGVLWGREPPPPSAGLLAQRVLGLAAGAKVDSQIAARLQQYIDSMAVQYASLRPPSWTTGSGSSKFGVDSKFIYLGPIKIPTAILALLPINIQSNPTETDFNKRLSAMREDLYEAARRSRNYADFKSAVQELRAETQAERDFSENQRTPPTSGGNQP